MTRLSIYEMFELDEQAIKTYSTFPRFTVKEAAAIMLNLNPYYSNHFDVEQERNFASLVSAIDASAMHDNFITAEFEYDINGNKWVESISSDELCKWANFYGYEWKLKPFIPFKSKRSINEPKDSEILTKLEAENAELKARIAELESQLQKQSAIDSKEIPLTGSGEQRISRPQRDIFTLLTVNNYPNCQSRNDLFNRINADLREKGITTRDIQYPTLDNLIDDDIRLGNPKKSPFPPKQK